MLIGGSSAGAYMRTALDRRLHYGYTVTGLGDASQSAHKIKAYYRVPLDATSAKAALLASQGNGGVLFIGPCYHSWFHSYSSGKLPPPDYQVGGHAIWARGWNDSLGVRLHNSWGPTWGLSGGRSPMAAIASSMRRRARHGAARPASATRHGKARCSRRSRASRWMT